MKPARLGLLIILAVCGGRVARADEKPPPTVTEVSMAKPDLKKLEDELYRHGLDGFRRIRASHPTEKFYCFAFYTSDEFSYVTLTASTIEGLDKVARDYKKQPSYRAMSIEDLRQYLKWSPCDSPLHTESGDVLVPLASLMQAVAAELARRCELNDGGRSCEEFAAQVRSAFANAIRRIEAEGVFGDGETRKDVVANLLMGDQSDEDRIGFAKRVNPLECVEMLKQDLEAASRLRR